MNKDIERAKRLLESKGYVVKKKHQLEFKGLDESDVVSLNEFLDIHKDECSWEETLEESLYEDNEEEDLSGDQLKEYEVGDIIMPKTIHSPASGMEVDAHRVLLIQSKKGRGDTIYYRGFLLSSKVNRSNKYGGYPNNIYISDYSTILYKGKYMKKEAYIRVDDVVEFTNKDLDASGVYKGTVTNRFFRFVNNCYHNYKKGISNKDRYWISDRRINHGRDRKETA